MDLSNRIFPLPTKKKKQTQTTNKLQSSTYFFSTKETVLSLESQVELLITIIDVSRYRGQEVDYVHRIIYQSSHLILLWQQTGCLGGMM